MLRPICFRRSLYFARCVLRAVSSRGKAGDAGYKERPLDHSKTRSDLLQTRFSRPLLLVSVDLVTHGWGGNTSSRAAAVSP